MQPSLNIFFHMDWICFGFYFWIHTSVWLDVHRAHFRSFDIRFHFNWLLLLCFFFIFCSSIYFFLRLVCRLATMSASVACDHICEKCVYCVAIFIATNRLLRYLMWQMLAIFALVRFHCLLLAGASFSQFLFSASVPSTHLCTWLRERERVPHHTIPCHITHHEVHTPSRRIQYTIHTYLLIAGDERYKMCAHGGSTEARLAKSQ